MIGSNLKILFGKRLKKLRKEKGITQEDFAEMIEITPRNLSKIESGHTFPSALNLEKIIKNLNCRAEELFKFDIKDVEIDKKKYLINALDLMEQDKIEILYKIVKSFE